MTKETKHIYLRPLETVDLDRTLEWHNSAELYENLCGVFWPVSGHTEAEWIQRVSARSANSITLAICLTKSGEHIGNLYLRDIDWISRHGELHLFIGDAINRGKGQGTQAIRLLLDHAFLTLGLQRIFLQVLADNERAIRVYEKCGFVTEGVLRKHAFKQGAFKDVILMGCIHP
jgi:RimJ/RimL family protein N-acetyltransferase